MKEKVNYGYDVWGWTLFWICVFALVFLLPLPGIFWWLWWLLFIILLVMTLCYTPVSVSADERSVRVRHPLRTTTIPLDQIKSVEIIDPTLHKSSASKGFGGYWGKGSDPKHGTYTSFVGKGEERFLITMDDGRKYMLSSNNAPKIVAYISDKIKK